MAGIIVETLCVAFVDAIEALGRAGGTAGGAGGNAAWMDWKAAIKAVLFCSSAAMTDAHRLSGEPETLRELIPCSLR